MHEKYDFRVNAMIAWSEYKGMKQSGLENVEQMQSEAYEAYEVTQVTENGH